MRLNSLALKGQYKGLKDQTFNFDQVGSNIVAFIGLNGSGKSQLLELISETFAYMERWQRPDFKIKKVLGFAVTVYYQWDTTEDSSLPSYHDGLKSVRGLAELRVSIDIHGSLQLAMLGEGNWHTLKGAQAFPIPMVIGYASGLNENLQRGFMKNAVQYYEVRRIISKRQKELAKKLDESQRAAANKNYAEKYPNLFYPDTAEAFEQSGYSDIREVNSPASRFVYLDYDNTSLLIACLSIMTKREVTTLLKELRFKHPEKLILKYDFHSGTIEQDPIRDVQLLLRIAGEENFTPLGKKTTNEQFEIYELDHLSGLIKLDLTDDNVKNGLREANYNDPFALFQRLHKIQQLGIKNWPYTSRQQLLRDDFLGTVKKPLKTKLPLSVVELLLADEHGNVVNFDDLSDGEAQLTQVLAAARVFDREQSLFLLDEPDTHLNPSWRTYFHSYLLNALDNGNGRKDRSQVFLSTHSPFMISSLTKECVFFFRRKEAGQIEMEPTASQTYGAAFDVLIKEHYGLSSLISRSVVEEVKRRLPKDETPESLTTAREWIKDNLGESMEKAYLLRKLRS